MKGGQDFAVPWRDERVIAARHLQRGPGGHGLRGEFDSGQAAIIGYRGRAGAFRADADFGDGSVFEVQDFDTQDRLGLRAVAASAARQASPSERKRGAWLLLLWGRSGLKF